MIAGLLSAAFLVGFLFGWSVVPLLGAGALVVLLARRQWAFVVALAVLAGVVGAVRADPLRGREMNSSWLTDDEVSGQIVSSVVDDGRTQRFVVRTDDGHRLCSRAFSRKELGRGDLLEMQIAADTSETISAGYGAYLRSRDCDWSATLTGITLRKSGQGILRTFDDVRSMAATRLTRWVPGDPGALLAGLVVGDDSLLSDDAMDAFQVTGTLHVVAISGSNLTLLVSLLLIVSFWSARRGITEVLALLAIWAYVLVGGAGPPTLRAGLLATYAAGARALGRPADLLSLSLQVAALQAFLWPSSVHGLSYQLSTAAIFGVLIATAGRSFTGLAGAVKLVVLTTVIVNLLLLPILPAQSRPSLFLSLLTNTAIAPFISMAFVLGLLAVALGAIHPLFGEPLAILAGQVNKITIDIVESIAGWDRLPGPLGWNASKAPLIALYFLAGAVLLLASTEFRRAARWRLRDLHLVEEATATIILGSSIGTCAAVVIVAAIR